MVLAEWHWSRLNIVVVSFCWRSPLREFGCFLKIIYLCLWDMFLLSCCDILRKGVRITGFDVQKMLYYFAALTFTWPGPRESERYGITNPNGKSTQSPKCWVFGFCCVWFWSLFRPSQGTNRWLYNYDKLILFHHCPCFKVDLGVLWVAGRILMESRGSKNRIWQGVVPWYLKESIQSQKKDVTRIDICIYIYM